MGKYTIHSTKEDYKELYEKLEVVESKISINFDWKKIKRAHFDSLEIMLRATERKYNLS